MFGLGTKIKIAKWLLKTGFSLGPVASIKLVKKFYSFLKSMKSHDKNSW